MSELLPCPFCGGEAERITEGNRRPETSVFCSKCDAKSAWRCVDDGGINEAIAAWNRRVGHTYPHMCRDGHPEIGHATDEEMCPVCIASAPSPVERAKDEVVEAAKNWKAGKWKAQGYPLRDEARLEDALARLSSSEGCAGKEKE